MFLYSVRADLNATKPKASELHLKKHWILQVKETSFCFLEKVVWLLINKTYASIKKLTKTVISPAFFSMFQLFHSFRSFIRGKTFYLVSIVSEKNFFLTWQDGRLFHRCRILMKNLFLIKLLEIFALNTSFLVRLLCFSLAVGFVLVPLKAGCRLF